MNITLVWLAILATVVLLAGYEAMLAVAQRRRPDHLARSAHAVLREEWFSAVSRHKGSEILAVQTLRNSLMAATMTASTAVLGLMGTVTDSDAGDRWDASGVAYVRRAGILYSWGLRHLMLVAPILAALLHPLAGPLAAALVVSVLYRFDRVRSDSA